MTTPARALPQDDMLQAAADALRRARAMGRPIARVSESHDIAGIDAAYAVAAPNTRARLAGHRFQVGIETAGACAVRFD